ncbi:S27A2 synthetase, partial [Crypturellus undulatus]|nr:S27A2 synthetase [Crypturellus undulatus]
ERRLARQPPVTLLDVFRGHARRRPRRALLRFGEELYTYGDVERRSNRVARALARHPGLRRGQTVAVFLPNCPAYVWTWLALAKLGCAMACVNSNARGRVLRHALATAEAAVMLTSPGE